MTFKRLVDWFGLHPMVGDSIVAGVMALLSIPVLITAVSDDSFLTVPPPRNGPGIALVTAWILGYSLPLVWRRTRPSLACALLVVPHLVQLAVGPIFLVQNISVLLMEFAIAAYGRRRARALWLGAGIVASLAAAVSWVGDAHRKYAPDQDRSTDSVTELFIVLAISVIASWLLGAFARERLTTMRSLKERAEALAAERDRFAQLAAEQERSRIAREMHDVVAHSLSVIVIQTDGAIYALDQPGGADAKLSLARAALNRIATASREALAETRALVGVLREGAPAETAPQPRPEASDELLEAARASGMEIGGGVVGSDQDRAPLGPARETAAYRIVQESLTNVIKHAGPSARVRVRVERTDAGLSIEVRDDGVGLAVDDGHGHGLIGMRERVAPFGGTLTARPRLDGGFEVLATIPAGNGGRDPASADPRSAAPAPVGAPAVEATESMDDPTRTIA